MIENVVSIKYRVGSDEVVAIIGNEIVCGVDNKGFGVPVEQIARDLALLFTGTQEEIGVECDATGKGFSKKEQDANPDWPKLIGWVDVYPPKMDEKAVGSHLGFEVGL